MNEILEQLAAQGLQATTTFPSGLPVLKRGESYPSFALYKQPDAVVVGYKRQLSKEVVDEIKRITVGQIRQIVTSTDNHVVFKRVHHLFNNLPVDMQIELPDGPTWLDSPERRGIEYRLGDLAYAQELLPKLEHIFHYEQISMLEKRYGFKLKLEVNVHNHVNNNIKSREEELAELEDMMNGYYFSESGRMFTITAALPSEAAVHQSKDDKNQLEIFVQYVLERMVA